MIDKFTVEKIKNAADIVEVVSDYVHLVRRGSNFMGLCPFHNERTPSFSVNRRRNFCYCFSCHKGGSPVNFIMEKEGISYHDALLQLAAKYGIKVEERELTDEEKASQTERESMFVANEWAMRQMQSNLKDTQEGQDVGLQYFYSRGITEEAIKEFRLGYALDSGNTLTDSARKAGFDLSVFKALGLVGVSQQGREYDRFHGRVIFPIFNSSGKTIGFGGRDLKGGPAKYINSPESEIYVKSNELYGIYQAKSDIVRQDKCFLVEGYMDVIGMWQAGMKNVIASSGTALTDGQIALIHRFTDNVTILYDGDAAGVKAALRGIDMLLSHKMNVKVLLLPDGKDPDEFAKEKTPEEFREYVARHETDIIRFKANVLLKEADRDPQKLSAAIMSVVESLAVIPNDIQRNIYVQECSRIFNIDENTIGLEVARKRNERIEKLILERNKKFQSEAINRKSVIANSNLDNGHNDYESKTAKKADDVNVNPLEPLERKIIENCLKYGFLDFCMADEDNPEAGYITVAAYINEELDADDLSLSVPVYSRILSLFDEYYSQYKRELSDYIVAADIKIKEELNKSFEEIRLKGLSISEIEREEKKIEEKLAKRRHQAYLDFAKEYPARVFASHEDDDIRKVVNDLVMDRYTLSNIFVKAQPPREVEDELDVIIPRCIIELKNEVLDIRINELKKKFSNLTDSDNEAELLSELNILYKMRREVTKSIGERIIKPRR